MLSFGFLLFFLVVVKGVLVCFKRAHRVRHSEVPGPMFGCGSPFLKISIEKLLTFNVAEIASCGIVNKL